MADGSMLHLKKLGRDFNPTDKLESLRVLHQAAAEKQVVTGVLYVETNKPTFFDLLNMTDEPLATLPQAKTQPPASALDEIMDELR
jgi:2-oxoglutarate ferredoxin oxidoreductase subunit beta